MMKINGKNYRIVEGGLLWTLKKFRVLLVILSLISLSQTIMIMHYIDISKDTEEKVVETETIIKYVEVESKQEESEQIATESIEEIVEEIEEDTNELDVLYVSSAKTYMDYRMITDVTSKQYQFIHNSGEITIDDEGYLRDSEGYYGVALGSYFGEIGSRYVFTLSTGKEIRVVKVEAKADIHTTKGYIAHDGSIIEFVIDTTTDYMRKHTYGNGYIFSGNFNNNEIFSGDIIKITKISE